MIDIKNEIKAKSQKFIRKSLSYSLGQISDSNLGAAIGFINFDFFKLHWRKTILNFHFLFKEPLVILVDTLVVSMDLQKSSMSQ